MYQIFAFVQFSFAVPWNRVLGLKNSQKSRIWQYLSETEISRVFWHTSEEIDPVSRRFIGCVAHLSGGILFLSFFYPDSLKFIYLNRDISFRNVLVLTRQPPVTRFVCQPRYFLRRAKAGKITICFQDLPGWAFVGMKRRPFFVEYFIHHIVLLNFLTKKNLTDHFFGRNFTAKSKQI